MQNTRKKLKLIEICFFVHKKKLKLIEIRFFVHKIKTIRGALNEKKFNN